MANPSHLSFQGYNTTVRRWSVSQLECFESVCDLAFSHFWRMSGQKKRITRLHTYPHGELAALPWARISSSFFLLYRKTFWRTRRETVNSEELCHKENKVDDIYTFILLMVTKRALWGSKRKQIKLPGETARSLRSNHSLKSKGFELGAKKNHTLFALWMISHWKWGPRCFYVRFPGIRINHKIARNAKIGLNEVCYNVWEAQEIFLYTNVGT